MRELNRRRFIQGAGALFGCGALRGGGRAFAAPSGLFSQGTPNLTLGILTDIHLKQSGESFNGQAMFRKALEWFRDQGVDAVAVCGDMADGGLLAELQAVAQTWSAVFPNDTAPDGRHVERLFIYGNHDYGGTSTGSIRGLGLAEAWQQTFGETYTPVWRKEVCGYTFVGAHWTTGGCKGYDEVGIPEGATWIAQNGATLDPSKPFFYLQHAPPKNTCLGPWHWGRDDGRITTALSSFPNAIAITGHSHASISDDRSIWQGAFTAINAGSLKYTGLEYGDLLPAVRENDGTIANNSGRIMSKIARDDGHQGLIARVYDDRIVFERRDFEDLGLLGPDWVMPLPMTEPVPLAFAPRAEASVPPEFPSGAALSARVGDVLEVEIPAANREGCPRVFDYKLEIEGSDGGSDERFVFAEGFHRSSGSVRANASMTCQVSAATLTATGELNVKVFPRNSFGKAGASLSATAVPSATVQSGLPDAFVEWVESNGTQYIDTGIKGRCNTRADMKIRWMLLNADASFLSSRIDGGNTRFILCSNSVKNKYYVCHKTWSESVNAGTSSYNTAGPDRVESSITHDGTDVTFTLRVNGNLEVNRTETTSAIDTNLNMFLFAQNKGGAADLKSSVRCYGVKIWQDGELVRDFRPCVKNGNAGLYDAVSNAVFYPSAGTLAAGPVTRLHGKPDHFIQYVEATGSQYVDTGVIGRCNSAMEAHVLWNYVSDGIFLASRVDSGNTRFILYGAAGRHYMAHRTYTQSTDSTRQGSVSGSPLVEWNLEAPDYISSSISSNGTSVSYWMKVNGTTRINQTRTEEGIDTGLNMFLFAQNMGGSPTYYSPVRCFDLKITQDGALVRDFRPCLKNGRAGLYDEVSGWIFFPQGGELAYPNEKPDRFVKWANAPGANYVPVAVRAKSGVRAEMKFRPEGTALDQYFLAARNSSTTDTRFLLNYLYRKSASNNCIAIGYRNKWCGRNWQLWSPGKDYALSSEIASDGTLNGNLVGDTEAMQTQSGAGGALGAFDTGLGLYMFAANMGGNAQDYYTGRFYYTTIDVYDETAGEYRPARDFKPCVKDGNVMFYDKVSRTMFKPYPAIPAEGNVGKDGLTIILK